LERGPYCLKFGTSSCQRESVVFLLPINSVIPMIVSDEEATAHSKAVKSAFVKLMPTCQQSTTAVGPHSDQTLARLQ
jgi:hypothetical protein